MLNAGDTVIVEDFGLLKKPSYSLSSVDRVTPKLAFRGRGYFRRDFIDGDWVVYQRSTAYHKFRVYHDTHENREKFGIQQMKGGNDGNS